MRKLAFKIGTWLVQWSGITGTPPQSTALDFPAMRSDMAAQFIGTNPLSNAVRGQMASQIKAKPQSIEKGEGHYVLTACRECNAFKRADGSCLCDS